jgi:molybdopterin molybdotransferase
MISFQEARQIIQLQAKSFGVETIDLENALDRVLAEDISASRDFPPFNRSMMDGIAINFDDFQSGIKEFKCVETVFAGSSYTQVLKTGECYKIMTGAAVPPSANVVIKIEDVKVERDLFTLLLNDFRINQNIAQQGQDIKKDEIAVRKGLLIKPATIGFLASLGKAKLMVEKLPKLNLITTGNEVLELTDEVSPNHIFNSNKYVLKSLLKQNHIQVSNYNHAIDDIETLKNVINTNLNNDILIITGGVSAGEADYIPAILEDLGVVKLFHKVAIKPGKPIWCGIFKNQTMVFALPGNPFSCLVTFKIFIAFYLNLCLGKTADEMNQGSLNFDRNKPSNLDEFFPVSLTHGTLEKIAINGSGDVRLGFDANALAMQMASRKEIKQGELLPYILL